MNELFALALAESKLKELQVGENHLLRFRHLVLKASEQSTLKLFGQFIVLIEVSNPIKVSSSTGIYHLQDTASNEQQYIHQGVTTLTNSSLTEASTIKFLQVIILNTSSHESPTA